ncbi:hypothetical protein [Agrobacterium vitis]|uniref:hypothetical protein n=1 Tax=Agrobacterium vitis TaxID=373 RepID=UPI003D2E1420
MYDVTAKVSDALVMAGLGKEQIARAMAGGQIYGNTGVLDSLGLVRLIGGISIGFEELGIDMFDMLEALDANPAEVFTDVPSIVRFTQSVLTSVLAERSA